MRKIHIPFLLAFVAVACQEGNITPEPLVVNDEMSFDVLAPGAQTKVANNAFESSDVIGLYVTDYVDEATAMPLQISGNRANNITVTYDGAVWTPEQTIYWGEGKSDVYAYYPYIQDIQDVESQYFEVAADQTGDGYEASDLIWAKAEGVRQTDGAVSLQMRHVMSKLTVKLVAGEDYVGSLPDDASVLLHSTVTGARVDFSNGSVSKDPYSGAESITMKKLGIRTFDGVKAVVYEAVVVPQMLEGFAPFIEIKSKSVSYLLEDSFNFHSGVSYTYTATLNASTTAIKVEIGCELEDWNEAGGGSDSGEGDSGEESDDSDFVDLSIAGTANCYLVQRAGNYKFKTLIGNTDATIGNVKSVEVLWESFGTNEKPNVGDLIASVSYKDGYVRFSTPEIFRNGNAVIAAKNPKGVILWSWHIWCSEEGWKEQVYFNDAGTMMDRNLGSTSANPGDVGTLGLFYQWGRKDPFMGPQSVSADSQALSTGQWIIISGGGTDYTLFDINPMTLYAGYSAPDCGVLEKTVYDPCPVGWHVPEGGQNGIWVLAASGAAGSAEKTASGVNFSGVYGSDEVIYYPLAGYIECYTSVKVSGVGKYGYYWAKEEGTSYCHYLPSNTSKNIGKNYGCSVRCQKED